MKVLIATGIYPPDIGGPATYCKIVADEFVRRGHDITIVTYGEQSSFPERSRHRAVSRRVPKGVRHGLYFLYVLRAGRNADRIYALDTSSAGLPARLAAFILRKQFIVRVVGDYAWEQGVARFGVKDLLDDFLTKKYGFAVTALRSVQSWVARSASAVVVPSYYLKSVVERWGVRSSHIHVIANSVHYAPVLGYDEARAKHSLDGFVLLTAGRLLPWKGFPCLLKVMRNMPENSTIRLIIAGDGPDREILEKYIAENALGGRIRLAGILSKDVLAEYVSGCDMFVLNTAYEGFSHQLLEVMLAGKPIVTTLAGGNKEIVQDEKNALAVEYNNERAWERAILRLQGDAQLRERLALAGLEYKNIYTVPNMIESLEALLEKDL